MFRNNYLENRIIPKPMRNAKVLCAFSQERVVFYYQELTRFVNYIVIAGKIN